MGRSTIITLSLYLLSLFVIVFAGHELLPYDPVASPQAVVISGNARFTILTPNVIRMEYSTSGRFEDRATLAFVNRKLPVPPFKSSITNGILTISTDALKLEYSVGKVFSSNTLTIQSTNPSSVFKSWYYGKPNPSNLLGTIKSLDELNSISLNCTINAKVRVHDEELHCEWGLISREGWSLVNDTPNWATDSNDWWAGRNTDFEDLYFFGHGYNYKGALYDFTLIAGKIAMVPRYASGIMWSIWYNLDNFDVRQIVNTYERLSIPLDVYILDMDWHTKQGWGGYTFDTRLFPNPSATLDWLHRKGLATSANIHDDDGLRATEKMYPETAKALGLDPKSTATIPFNLVNATVLYAMEDIVLKDVENQGLDFWWIDWQQGGQQGGLAGGKQNPTIWLNRVRGTDHIRRNEPQRGMVLARWGGLGTHRYQIGFSGDVNNVAWPSLAFQPYFTFTASNVGYGYFSHDLVGPPDDHELHTRWLQWGAYSGAFRTHDRGSSAGDCANTNPPSCGIVAVWKVPDRYFQVNRAVMIARERLVPYIYTALRQAYDTGVSLLRPMYYEYPQFDNAYAGDSSGHFAQYFFGDDMIVSPVVFPAGTNNMASISVWIPPGQWIEKDTGVLLQGNADGSTILTKAFDLTEVPIFVRAGAIIAERPVIVGDTLGLAARQYTTLEISIYPGQTNGMTRVYEDDGATTAYVNNQFVNTLITYTRDASTTSISISSSGAYAEFPKLRSYRILLINHLPVQRASVNGAVITYSAYGGPNTWHYDGVSVTTILETFMLSTTQNVNITITTEPVNNGLLSGIKGGIVHAILAKQNLDESRVTPGAHSVTGGIISEVASTGEYLSYLAGTDLNLFNTQLKNFPNLFAAAVKEIKSLQGSIQKDDLGHDVAVNPQRLAYSVALLENAFN